MSQALLPATLGSQSFAGTFYRSECAQFQVNIFNPHFSDSPFGPSHFRRSINRKSGRFARRSMRRAERPEIKINNEVNNNGAQNGTDVSVRVN